MKGKYPAILQDDKFGPEAQKLFADAQERLREIIDQQSAPRPRGLWVLASRRGRRRRDPVHGRTREQCPDAFPFSAPTMGSPRAARFPLLWPTTSLPWIRRDRTTSARSWSPRESVPMNWQRTFEAQHDDYNAIMVKALADRLAEALAEWLHRQARDATGVLARRNS